MGCLAEGACRLVHLDAFDLYAQQHILLEAVLLNGSLAEQSSGHELTADALNL
jgi:hypothetical protein